jgi:hypothetical protein
MTTHRQVYLWEMTETLNDTIAMLSSGRQPSHGPNQVYRLLPVHVTRRCIGVLCKVVLAGAMWLGIFCRTLTKPVSIGESVTSASATELWERTAVSQMTMTAERSDQEVASQSSRRALSTPSRSIFAVPAPIKQLFDRFPLLTYAPNNLPQRAPTYRDAHTLFIFATEREAAEGAPSYNPACLKWQVWKQIPRLGFSS